MHFGKRKIAGLSVFVIACVIGVSAYAFTASNTVASHSAGAGAATVSGYEVTSPTNYTFSGDGLTMTKVTFDLDKAATDVPSPSRKVRRNRQTGRTAVNRAPRRRSPSPARSQNPFRTVKVLSSRSRLSAAAR